MPKQIVQNVGLGSILGAGLKHSINPASLLGVILFIILMVRVQRRNGKGALFGACLLFTFFIFQMLVHLALSDLFYTLTRRMAFFWYGVCILTGIGAVILGICLFRKSCSREGDLKAEVERVLCLGMARHKSWGRFKTVIAGLGFGLFFVFLCGNWPLNSGALNLVYEFYRQPTRGVFWKFIFFEMVAMLPFLAALFFMARAFSSEKFYDWLCDNRMVVLVFSACCVAVGAGALIYWGSLFFL